MRIKTSLITVALLLSCWSATAAIRTAAQQEIRRLCGQEPLRSSLVGVLAVRADGDTLVAVDIRRKLVPASNVKLLTTGLALHVLGADFRFRTQLGYAGEIRDSVLVGDLYLLGGGDPTTGSRSDCAEALSKTFSAWEQILREAGIRGITGRILGDPRFFAETTAQNLGWTFDDLGFNYGAGPLGLNFFENAQLFYVTPGPSVGAGANVSPRYPDTPWMRFANHTVTGPARSANTLYYVNTTLGPYGEVAGSFPVDRRGYTLECANQYGAYTCAAYFCDYLRGRGMTVTGGFGDITPQGEIRTDLIFREERTAAAQGDEIVPLGETFSPRLADIVRDTNAESDNFYAETLLRMVAKQKGYSTDQDGCQDAADAGLRSMGLRTDNCCQLFDGSGLSRKNYVSADFFVRFLRRMMGVRAWEAFFASLPVPGAKGTLENRFEKAPQAFKDRIHMKSGSMNGVRSYSGYILAADGDPAHTIVFSLLINNCTASTYALNPVVEGMIEALAAEN